MANKLYHTPRPATFRPGKPKMPSLDDPSSRFLHQLIGPRSWLLFGLLGLGDDQRWMLADPEEWHLHPDYCRAEDFVQNLEVVNDCAERGIKMISDFKDIVKSEDQLKLALQVIEDHRNKFPTVTKQCLNQM